MLNVYEEAKKIKEYLYKKKSTSSEPSPRVELFRKRILNLIYGIADTAYLENNIRSIITNLVCVNTTLGERYVSVAIYTSYFELEFLNSRARSDLVYSIKVSSDDTIQISPNLALNPRITENQIYDSILELEELVAINKRILEEHKSKSASLVFRLTEE